jgi:hypothetical protein
MKSLNQIIHRATKSAAAALLVVSSGLGVAACSSSTDVGANPPGATPLVNESQLRNGMRQLWEEHVVWTRVFLIDAVSGLGDTSAATARLLKNQDDIGDAIKPFYGDAAGAQLTSLLRDHITIAAEVVTAAKAGDAAALADAKTRWYANADEIATFLASANPNWSAADLKTMMKEHLDQTLAEAVAQLTGDYAGEIAAYGHVRQHILDMADALTAGVIAQFPTEVAPSPLTDKEERLYLAMRVLWEDHVSWTRFFLIDDIADLPGTSDVTNRLLQNQLDIGDAIKPFYGEAAGNQLASLLHDHIAIAAELVADAKSRDSAALAAAKIRWYTNADQIAQFLASANPNWPLADLEMMMHQHLDRTLAEATARLGQDWAGDIADYDEIEGDILTMADALSEGIAKQFPAKVQ